MVIEQRFLGPQVTGRMLSFYLLPTSEIKRILEVTRKGHVGAIASFVQQNDNDGPNRAYKLFYKRGSQEKYFSLDRKSGTFCFDIQPLLLLGKSAASGLLSRLLGSSR